MFRCGPCPLKAIKEGDLNVKFDAPFIFAEVNADIINWEIGQDGQKKRVGDYYACLYFFFYFTLLLFFIHFYYNFYHFLLFFKKNICISFLNVL